MKAIVSCLGRYSLLVNYFFFFALSMFLNIAFVYIPFELHAVLANIVRFFLFFSVVVYVTNNPKVIRISFWTMIGVSLLNMIVSILQHHVEVLTRVEYSMGASFVISLITLYILLLLWSNCLPKMRGIIGSLCAVTIYSGFISFPVSTAVSSLVGSAETGATFAFAVVPFLLMMLLFFFIIRDGRKRGNERC